MRELIPVSAFIMLLLNLTGFFMMGYDKRMAIKEKRRISEKRLIVISAVGGAMGVMLGMKCFHHKTRHALFVYGMPLLILFNLVSFYYIYRFLV